MNPKLFQQLFARRTTYPLGVRPPHENVNDEQYIRDEIALQADGDFTFLLLTDFHLDKHTSRSAREKLLESHKIVGVFGVGELLSPFTNIKFNLYVLSTYDPQKLWFGELSPRNKPFEGYTHRLRFNDSGMIEPIERKPEAYFVKYLESINLAIHGGKKDDYVTKKYRIFGVDTSRMADRYSIDYYKPELIEAEAKLAHEQTVKLSDIAKIIYPRGMEQPKTQYTISLKNAKYPLKPDMLTEVRSGAATAPIQRFDIVTNTFMNSAYLNLTKRPDLVVANTQVIIRLHDKRFTHAYLTAYLNSERMRAYFMRRSIGAVMPRISRQDLADFEVVIPTSHTNKIADEILSSLGEYESEKQRIDAINKALFVPAVSSSKPLQNELLTELHAQLQATKNLLIKDLFDVDLHEIEKCYKAEAYKGCLVLCGSLLETLVLDWLSELEQKDYFSDDDVTSLESMINRLRDAEVLTVHELQMAHEVRKKRNLIHPKNYIENTPLHREICQEVMTKLKPLVRKRYNYNKESAE